MVKEWDRYIAPGGRDKLSDDIRKLRLTAAEKVQVKEMMDACAAGALSPPAIKPLGGTPGLWEIRIIGERSFRLVYADQASRNVLLGLSFFRKQANSQPADIRVAVERFKVWQRDHPTPP